MPDDEKEKTIFVGIRLSSTQMKIIDKLVNVGYAKTRSAFVYGCVISELNRLGVFSEALKEMMEEKED